MGIFSRGSLIIFLIQQNAALNPSMRSYYSIYIWNILLALHLGLQYDISDNILKYT